MYIYHSFHVLLGITKADLRKKLESPSVDHPLFLAKYSQATEEIILGTVELETDIIQNERAGLIGLLSVDPELQALGIGKKLVQAAESYCKQRLKLHWTAVWVLDSREEILKWYTRMGYIHTEETRDFVYPDKLKAFGHFLVLRKHL